MPDSSAQAELLRSLGRLVRGLSSLFWGLPLALLVCVQSAKMDWLQPFNVFPALAATGLLFFGLVQISGFQRQERPWRAALDRAKLLSLINCGLSPFLFWWNGVPDNAFFSSTLAVLALSGVLFLFSLNLVLLRLGDMLPDPSLRGEMRQFTALNRYLLATLLLLSALFLATVQIQVVPVHFEGFFALANQLGQWVLLFLALLPLALTMALLWKTKEVVLESVFGPK
jgi:hypothetical protein